VAVSFEFSKRCLPGISCNKEQLDGRHRGFIHPTGCGLVTSNPFTVFDAAGCRDDDEPSTFPRCPQLGLRPAVPQAPALAEASDQGLPGHDNNGCRFKLHRDDPLVPLSAR
jgi:hypothetical protein